jgi:hypothetical protein
VPSDAGLWNQIKSSVNVDNITRGLHDLEASWILLIVSAVIAFVMGFVTMIMMKCCAPLLIWGIILSYLALITASGFLFYFKSNGTYQVESLDFIDNQLTDSKQALLGFLINFH